MKKAVCILMILTAVAVLAACQSHGIEIYSFDTRNFIEAVGDVTPTSAIDSIVIDWVAGNVTVKTGSQESVTVHETAVGSSADVPLYYKVSNSTLTIAFAKNGTQCKNLTKNLTVTVPQGRLLSALTVNSVSSTVHVDSAVTGELSVEAVAGRVECAIDRVDKVEVSTTSASVNLRANYAHELNVETVSGTLNLTLPSFDELEIESTSGNVGLTLAKDASFTMTASSVSGHVSTGDFACTMSGKRYISGTGTSSIEVETVSGNITLKSA